MRRKDLGTTARTRPRMSSLADLITNSQNTITSSQATVYTDNSQRATRTQSLQAWNDLQDYEDIIGEESQTLRITPEEERRIQSILELTRKGKINPGNAFQIPIKVANSHVAEDQNMRFWKFASELLSASMGIYDKRVEHVYLGTNRMFESLVRVGTNNAVEEQPEERNRRQRGAILKMDLSQIGSTQAIASYDFANVSCEEPDKISIKKNIMQFATDPLFNKRLKAFDSDSMNSLFINIFEVNSSLQVNFFHDSKSTRSAGVSYESQEMPPLPIDLPSNIMQSDEQSTKTCGQFSQIPRFITEQFKRVNFIAQNNNTFANLSNFKKENQREGLLGINNLLDTDLDFDFEERHDRTQIEGSMLENEPQDFGNNQTSMRADVTQYSEQLQTNSQFEDSNQYAMSERFSPQLFLSATSRQSTDMMTPWDLEFKGMRLQKKKRIVKKGQEPIKRKPKNAFEQLQIDFLNSEKTNGQQILSKVKNPPSPLKRKIFDKNLMPLSVHPFIKIFAQPPTNIFISSRINQIQNGGFLHTTQEEDNRSSSHQADIQQSNHNMDPLGENYDEIPLVNLQSQGYNGSQYQKVHIPANPYKNIRVIKDRLFNSLMEKGEIRLSQINLGINEQSSMLIILHLANEMKLQIVESTDVDIIIRPIY